jgi:hypothetical protein
MPYINHDALDAYLNHIKNNTTHLHVVKGNDLPTTYGAVTGSNLVGTKASPGFTGPAAGDTNGRKLTINAISDGVVNGTGDAKFFALTTGSVLLYANELGATQYVTDGNVFSLTACKIELPDPA